MTPETIEIVKATAPVIKDHGQEITQRMYEIAFDARPDARHLFVDTWMVNSEEGRKQAGRLAGAVYAYAQNIDALENLSGPIEHIAQKHVETKILPETYPVIGECLLRAIKDVLGEGATPAILGAWEEAYNALAKVFIEREKEIYRERNAELFPIEDSR
jgi:nitric oxide dioxygenase